MNKNTCKYITAFLLLFALLCPMSNGKTAFFDKTVIAEAAVTGKLSLSLSKLTLYCGEKNVLLVKGADEGAKISYSSSNKEIAAIGKSTGIITGKTKGSARLTAKVILTEEALQVVMQPYPCKMRYMLI